MRIPLPEVGINFLIHSFHALSPFFYRVHLNNPLIDRSSKRKGVKNEILQEQMGS